MSNGTNIYQYANGTVEINWGYGIVSIWNDSDCNYTEYYAGTWAYC
jgi:hypothetical protein